jgi:transposase-like protein
MEQRSDAVLDVIRDGFTVTEVAQKFGPAKYLSESRIGYIEAHFDLGSVCTA